MQSSFHFEITSFYRITIRAIVARNPGRTKKGRQSAALFFKTTWIFPSRQATLYIYCMFFFCYLFSYISNTRDQTKRARRSATKVFFFWFNIKRIVCIYIIYSQFVLDIGSSEKSGKKSSFSPDSAACLIGPSNRVLLQVPKTIRARTEEAPHAIYHNIYRINRSQKITFKP